MPAGRGEPSAVAMSRRAQIVAATIDTVADLGYRRTTFARIAERGGLSSTRLISYHFAGKNELVKEVVAHIFGSIDRFMVGWADVEPASRPINQPSGTPRLPSGGPASAELRAYITGTAAFIDRHRTQMRALQSIFAALHDDTGNEARYAPETYRAVLGHIQGILRRGQADGEFRDFDTLIMAATIQRSLDGLFFLLQAEPGLDLAKSAEEMVTLFNLATLKDPDEPE
ncbi:TetR family transcriptional regulator [Spirillospora sp. NBC_00431]